MGVVRARRATTEELNRLTVLLKDTPDNAIIWHLMRRDGAAVWFVGETGAPNAVGFDYRGDLHGIGTPDGLAAVALAAEDWHSFSVAWDIADDFEHRLRQVAPGLRRLEDLHWVLRTPPRIRQPNGQVRVALATDLKAIHASGLWRDDDTIADAVRQGHVACAFHGAVAVGGAACTAWSPRPDRDEPWFHPDGRSRDPHPIRRLKAPHTARAGHRVPLRRSGHISDG